VRGARVASPPRECPKNKVVAPYANYLKVWCVRTSKKWFANKKRHKVCQFALQKKIKSKLPPQRFEPRPGRLPRLLALISDQRATAAFLRLFSAINIYECEAHSHDNRLASGAGSKKVNPGEQ
jgi:hypothetical protein